VRLTVKFQFLGSVKCSRKTECYLKKFWIEFIDIAVRHNHDSNTDSKNECFLGTKEKN